MNLYMGDFWVPFPSSEYGGTWSVIAENEAKCVDILTSIKYYEDYDSLIPGAVAKAKCFELNPEQNYIPGVVDYFFT
jgi:predicted metalloprotease